MLQFDYDFDKDWFVSVVQTDLKFWDSSLKHWVTLGKTYQ